MNVQIRMNIVTIQIEMNIMNIQIRMNIINIQIKMNIQRVMKLTVNIQSMQRNTHKQLKFSDMTIRLLPMTPLL